jgi:hypothetical protein
MSEQASAITATNVSDPEYDGLRERVAARFQANLATFGGNLFTTDATGLFDAYLAALPEPLRQHCTCAACRKFFDSFGGLVVIGEDGIQHSASWRTDDAPDGVYERPIAEVARLVNRAEVTGVFLSPLATFGQPVTGKWTHYFGEQPKERIYRGVLKNASQAMAEKKEDYGQVARALGDFSPRVVGQALRIAKSDTLYRSEKILGQVEWLHKLHEARDGARGSKARDNLLWKAVASAPAGFCHPRSSMAGTLLEDLAAGMGFDEVSRRFSAKMHPLQYQRPQARPSVGNIAEAEKVVEKLGIKASLRRRFATVDDIEVVWRPKVKESQESATEGVFAHLTPKAKGPSVAPARLPATTMTWEKFAREILPDAESISLYVPSGPDNFCAFVTAADPESPPILQWDSLDRRNPVSWYVYHVGSMARDWGLPSGVFHNVTAFSLRPSMWHGGNFAHQGRGVVVILEGAKDSRHTGSGLALFPECLRSELHGIRSTIEAFSKAGTIEGYEAASACGLLLQDKATWHARLEVRDSMGVREIVLDRWD